MVKLNWTKEEKEEAIERMRANLPPDMLKYNNFVCFSLEPDTTSHSGYSKKPKNPKKPKNAKSNDPTTWGSFDEAAGAWIKSSTLHGIGFMFGNSPFFGVDIDDMGDKLNSGDFDGADMVQALHTYTEYSPSGTGLHCICMGELPPEGRKNKTTKMEMYSDGRFFTMTGNVYAYPRTISDCTESIKPYHAKYIKPPSKPKKPTQTHRPAAVGTLAEDEIIRKASNAANGSTFKALYFDGDTSAYGGDDSAADMALCNLLAFWTGKDAGTMDTLFRKSALYRPKWDEKRGTETYGEITINEAINFCDRCYEGGSAPKYIISSPDFVAYNFDGTPETSTAAGTAAPAADTDTQSEEIVRLSDLTLEQIKALTTEQWNGIIYQHYKTPAETESVTQKFARFYERCYRGRLLQDNGLLPLYIQPIIKTRRQNGLIYTTLAGFEINPVPLARSIQEDHHIINIPSGSSTAGLLYIYKNGKYERIDGEEERGVVRDRLELIDHMGKIWNTKTVKDTSLLLHSPSETHELDEFNADETIINFQNGILDLTTGTLYPHSHARLTTVQLPLSYDPSAGTDTPIFDSMIDHFAGGDDEVKTLLLQMCALAISNVDMGNLKCFLMMYGARDSGKSQLFKLLHKLIGEKNTHTTTLHKLENNNFEPMNLYGKRFAGHAELDNNSTVRHVGIVKALTGGDYVSGEVKCGGVYNFRYKGVLMFCSNDKPRLPSADAAFYERLRLVYVAKSVDTKDLHFLDKMWSERQKIINKLLPYLHAVITDGQVLDPASSKVLKKAYKAENNPAIEFFVECCEMRPKEEYDTNARKGITDGQDSKFIYDKFYRWCLDSGYTAHDIPVRNEFAKSVGRYLAAESKSDSEDVKVHKRNGNYYTFKLSPYACTDMNTIAETDTDSSAGAERAAELDMTATEFEQFGDVLI